MNAQNSLISESIPNPDGPDADLPIIVLPSDKVSITKAATDLFKRMAKSHRFFLRGGKVAKLKQTKDSLLVLDILDHEEARSDFEKFGRLFVWRASKNGGLVLRPTVCTGETARGLLASDEIIHLPVVNGLINCPVIFEADGEICVASRGYDARTKLLVTGGELPPEVDLPTAVDKLLELLAEFDFQSEGDKGRAVSSFISPTLKLGGFIKGPVPADVAEADQSQSGKTYRQKIGPAMHNERVSLVTNRQGGVGSVDESLSQQLVTGRPFIQFDNFRGRLDSQHLESFLTAEHNFPCRIPRKPEITVPPENFFVLLTSNGVDTSRDFANRSVIIRIRKKPLGFIFRKYSEGDLLAHVRQNQSFYLGCIFAVVRAWHSAGKPRTDETRHDFREWVGVLDWIVQNLFKLPPLMEGHEQAQQRVSNPDLVFLRAVALKVAEAQELGQPKSASDIQATCEAADISIPGLRDAGADADRASRVIGGCMRRLFKEKQEIEVDGFRIERSKVMMARSDLNGSFEQKTYTFARVGDPKVEQKLELPLEAISAPGNAGPFPRSYRAPDGAIVVDFSPNPFEKPPQNPQPEAEKNPDLNSGTVQKGEQVPVATQPGEGEKTVS